MPEVEQIINMLTGSDNTVKEENKRAGEKTVQQFYCDARSQSDLNDFVDSSKPKLVALVGFVGFGKSTFIGSLYQKLIENLTYLNFSFVDSDTYVGFERRVFLRRVNEYNASDTKRNILGENDILNVKLKSQNGTVHQILISDKAGETYQKYLSSNDDIERDIVLMNSDLVIFFIDAEADSKSLAKHNLIVDDYSSLLKRLKKLNKVGPLTKYLLVFTKFDKVTTDEKKAKLAERKVEIENLFERMLGERPEHVCEVNSTDLNNKPLEYVFAKLLCPLAPREEIKELDWVKTEIEKEK